MPPPLLRILMLASLLAAPAAAAPRAEAVITAYFAALEARDRPAIDRLFAANAIVEYPVDVSGRTEPDSWRRFEGHDAVMTNYVDRAFGRISRFAWRDREVTVAAGGKRVFVEALGDMTIDGIGAIGGGKPYANRYVFRFDVAGGRITHLKEYLNPVTSAIATGSRTGADTPR